MNHISPDSDRLKMTEYGRLEFHTHAEVMKERRIRNAERLAQLLRAPVSAVVFDVDGVVRAKGRTCNGILEKHVELLKRGVMLCPCTARGETLRDVYLNPMSELLSAAESDPALMPMLSATRNGAMIEAPWRSRVIEHHPIPLELSDAIIKHPWVTLLERLTPEELKVSWVSLNRDLLKNYGVGIDPRSARHPGLYLDRHTNGDHYKITLYYDASALDAAVRAGRLDGMGGVVSAILNRCDGAFPKGAVQMAACLRSALEEQGLSPAVSASYSDPHIDITAPGVNKSFGYRAVRSLLSSQKGEPEASLDKQIITLGDSPEGNDRELLGCGTGVTNIDFFTSDGPVVIAPEGITDPLQRSLYFFSAILPAKGADRF